MVPIFSEAKDTTTSVLSRSPFLFDAIVGVGCRAEQGLDSTTFRQIQSRLREHLTDLLVTIREPSLEEVQAVTLMAAYSENGYMLVAIALRFATQLELQHTVDKLLARTPATHSTMGADDHELYRLARVWLGICNLELLYGSPQGSLNVVLLTIYTVSHLMEVIPQTLRQMYLQERFGV